MGQPYDPAFQCWIFAAFFISFAIKVPMFPFHTWLPAAHVEAPTAGSVLLASILLKMGAYGFLRFCLPITPYATHVFAPYVLWLSVAAILYGGFAALAQTDLKKLVAYSSVGHMGFATLGIFALNTRGHRGRHPRDDQPRRHHGRAVHRRRHRSTSACTPATSRAAAGLGKFMPVFSFFLGVFCLSSLAFPGTNSFIGEFLVLAGGFAHSNAAGGLRRAGRGRRRGLQPPHAPARGLRRHRTTPSTPASRTSTCAKSPPSRPCWSSSSGSASTRSPSSTSCTPACSTSSPRPARFRNDDSDDQDTQILGDRR